MAVPASTARPASGASSTPQAGRQDSTAGISWTAPPSWVSEGSRPMRAATYRVPAAGSGEAGECAVFYFGPGQGGDVESNLKRWIGQFEQPDGKSSEQAARINKETVNGLSATLVDLSGTYMAGGPMAAVKEPRPGYRLLGAIVEAPEGNVFFKLTGAAETVAANAVEFRKMLNSVRKM